MSSEVAEVGAWVVCVVVRGEAHLESKEVCA